VGETPILLPYFGAETVVNDALSLRLFMAVLKGHFVRVTVGQVVAASRVGLTQVRGTALLLAVCCAERLLHAHAAHVQLLTSNGWQLFAFAGRQARGHFAVPISSEHEQALPLEKMLLQVAASQSGSASAVHYLLAEETRTLLNLVGPQAHLFDLLCVHANDGHVDRHFATHVGTLKRKGEGHVLINAHPAFRDPLSITGSAQLRLAAGVSTCSRLAGVLLVQLVTYRIQATTEAASMASM
jgi:hypothetical protein